MGLQKGSVYTFIAQLILIYLLVLLFLLVMLVIIGNAPVLILFTAPGIFLQVVLIIYFWLFLFSLPKSPIFKKSKKIVVHIANLQLHFIRALHLFRFNNRLWIYMKGSSGNKHARHRVTIIFLLPLTIFLWMTGWILCCIGAQRIPSRTAQKKTINISKKGTCERETLKEASPQQILAQTRKHTFRNSTVFGN